MKKIAVYGSLKKGAYNHKAFGLGEPLAHGKVRGAMALCFSFPRLFEPSKVPKDDVYEYDVEVYEVDDEVYEQIENMELGAGYYVETIRIGEHDCSIFYSGGDWGRWSNSLIRAYNAETVPVAFD